MGSQVNTGNFEIIYNFLDLSVCVCARMRMLSHFSHVFANPWTRQAPLSVVFSRQEYWSGLSCPPLGNHPILGIEPRSLVSPALAGGFFTTSATWEAIYIYALKRFLRPGATWDYNEWHILKSPELHPGSSNSFPSEFTKNLN